MRFIRMGYRNWKEVSGERTYFYHTEDGLSVDNGELRLRPTDSRAAIT